MNLFCQLTKKCGLFEGKRLPIKMNRSYFPSHESLSPLSPQASSTTSNPCLNAMSILVASIQFVPIKHKLVPPVPPPARPHHLFMSHAPTNHDINAPTTSTSLMSKFHLSKPDIFASFRF